ncbi:hypothetical protein BKP35_05010 [Anaerobacillus arseniciselenatis]|uniref:ABC transporter domain-containing protein n=1 Tax=Anaerobacillus arseniciselenatis TaxID=85682 RepID=A0A1S2LRQ8_9BACI|nr:ABC transporter ATP-binding protein [Anaerobacillus arseniciselenatis]OIJ15209.1 hypothetical protein BKP35_05010 [Anaerobacillus arseniciselenatis]
MSKSSTILQVHDICRYFDEKEVIHNVSFQVEEGDIFGFLGPNGAGKTTIIRMILGLIKSDSGTIKINNYDIKSQFLNAINKVGAVVETPTFHENLSGYQNLLLIKNLHPELPKSRIDEVLEIVGLTSRAKDKVHKYSLGMKQRLGLARALINYPKIVFLDEPTNGIDPQGVVQLRELIVQLAIEEKITFFITSHILHEIEQICNKVAVIKGGHLVAHGYVKDLLSKEVETVDIVTEYKKDALKLMKPLDFIEDMVEIETGVRVSLKTGHSGELNKLLNNHLQVDYLIPVHQSLENVFFELTGGGKNE